MSHRTTSGFDWIWRVTRVAIYLRDGFKCLGCGRGAGLSRAASLSLDHIKGRSNRPSNLLTVCVSCNAKRSDKSLEEWAGVHYAAELRAHARKPLDRVLAQSITRATWPRWSARQVQRRRTASARRWFEAA